MLFGVALICDRRACLAYGVNFCKKHRLVSPAYHVTLFDYDNQQFGYGWDRTMAHFCGQYYCTIITKLMNVTIITGASSGIGEAFARRLAAEGHNLLLVARSEVKLSQLCQELTLKHSITAQYLALNLVESGADERLLVETQTRRLEVNCLINNAGIGSAGEFTDLDLKSEQDLISLNITALVSLTHRFLPLMRNRRSGTIINVASMAAMQPIPYMATYAASKVFVRSFTEALAEECRPYGIRIMLLIPGATETGFFDAAKIGTANKNRIGVSSTQTSEEVVDAAVKGLKSHKQMVISGWRNTLMARLSALVPNAMMARVIGNQIGPNFRPQDAPK